MFLYMDTEKLESYAELIVKVGANVQEGQDVIISAELDQPEFVEMLVEQCYLAAPPRSGSSGRISRSSSSM